MNKKKLLTDYIFNLLRMIVNIGLPVIILPFVINRIGPENYGIFAYTNSIVSYFTMAALLGIPDYAFRIISRKNALSEHRNELCKTVTEILSIQFISVSIALLLYFAAFYSFFSIEYKPIFLIFSILIASGYLNTEWFYLGRQKFKYIALRSMLIKMLNAAVIILVIKDGDNSYKYVLITVLTSLANGLVNIIGVIPFIRFKNLSIKQHIKPIMVLFGLAITGLINSSIDKTLIGILVGPIYVGYYAVGFRLSRVVQQIFSSLNNIVFPRVTALLATDDKKQSDKLIRFSMDYIFMFSFPMILGLVLYAKDIITIFFKAELVPAVYSLIILAGTVPVIAILGVIRRHVLLSRDKDSILIVLSLITTLTNIAINLILVPHYKHVGAAVATLFAESAGMIFGMIYIYNKFNILLLYTSQLKYLLATPVIFIPWWVSKYHLVYSNTFFTLLLNIGLSAILYFIILFIIRDDIFYRYTKKYLFK